MDIKIGEYWLFTPDEIEENKERDENALAIQFRNDSISTQLVLKASDVNRLGQALAARTADLVRMNRDFADAAKKVVKMTAKNKRRKKKAAKKTKAGETLQ